LAHRVDASRPECSSIWLPAYDEAGNAKCLRGRTPDPSASAIAEIPDSVRDEALVAVCKAFGIPVRQMYCLRSEDSLLSLYQGMNGLRNFDALQFESLWFELQDIIGRKLSARKLRGLKR